MLQLNNTGEEVRTLQRQLIELGYNPGGADGIFGKMTLASVVKFQGDHGLVKDGIVGPQTLETIDQDLQTKKNNYLSYGAKSANVGVIQAKLNKLGFNCGAVDNVFGNMTRNAVISFQKVNGLVPDGIVGPLTLSALETKLDVQLTPITPVQSAGRVNVVNIPNHFDQVPDRNETKYIIIHHEGGDSTFEETNNYHLSKGWAGIGYHFFIDTSGTIYQGRPIKKVPAACYGLNDSSVNICLRGNFMSTSPAREQLAALYWLASYIKGIYGDLTVIGHKEAHNIVSWATTTDCPGRLFPLADVKAQLK